MNTRSSSVTARYAGMIVRSRAAQTESFVTLDGSTIRELMHPARHGNRAQSLAEATVPQGESTRRHYHIESEELYCILAGEGIVHLGEERLAVSQGDTVLIPPGTHHCIDNTGQDALVFLCCCAPAYSDHDTCFP